MRVTVSCLSRPSSRRCLTRGYLAATLRLSLRNDPFHSVRMFEFFMAGRLSILPLATLLILALLQSAAFAEDSAAFLGRLSIEVSPITSEFRVEDAQDSEFSPSDSDAVVEGATLESGTPSIDAGLPRGLSLSPAS